MSKQLSRCSWCTNDPKNITYHDHEWGVPVKDDQILFEFLTLEGAQAGLSWLTILKKRDGYRKSFANFEVKKVAKFSEKRIEKLILDPSIVRNKLKIKSTVSNAKLFLAVQKEFGSFYEYSMSFINGKCIDGKRKTMDEIPATSIESDAFSKDLKKRGFKFVGSTIIYAFMQATGMVNDHLTSCFRYKVVKRL